MYFEIKDAILLADYLNKNETEGWKYRVVPTRVTKVKIMVIDSEGHKLGYLKQ
jgi:hypothetical protein